MMLDEKPLYAWCEWLGTWSFYVEDTAGTRVLARVGKIGWKWNIDFPPMSAAMPPKPFWWLSNAKAWCEKNQDFLNRCGGMSVDARYVKCKGCFDYPRCIRRFGAGRINFEVDRNGRYYNCPIMHREER